MTRITADALTIATNLYTDSQTPLSKQKHSPDHPHSKFNKFNSFRKELNGKSVDLATIVATNLTKKEIPTGRPEAQVYLEQELDGLFVQLGLINRVVNTGNSTPTISNQTASKLIKIIAKNILQHSLNEEHDPVFEPIPLNEVSSNQEFVLKEHAPDLLTFLNSDQKNSENWRTNLLLKFETPVQALSGKAELAAGETTDIYKNLLENISNHFIPYAKFYINARTYLLNQINNPAIQKLSPAQFCNKSIYPKLKEFVRDNEAAMTEPAKEKLKALFNTLYMHVRKLEKSFQSPICISNRRFFNQSIVQSFIGGISEGRSFGLRAWIGEAGGVGPACDATECIIVAIWKLPTLNEDAEKCLSVIRPHAENVLNKLKTEIPVQLQKRGDTHPPLPYFNRLETALKTITSPELGRPQTIELE